MTRTIPAFAQKFEPQSLVEIVARPAVESPTGIAVRLWDRGREIEVVRWGQLWGDASVWARLLREAGMAPGSRVMLMLPTSSAFISSFFAVLLGGGVPVPVIAPSTLQGPSFLAQAESLKRVAQDSGAVVCLTSSRVADACRNAWLKSGKKMLFLTVDGSISHSGSISMGAISSGADPDATALLQYTSGSTDQPKGVELTHRNVLANLNAIANVVATEPGTGFSWLPLYHDMGLIGSLLTALYARRPLILMPPQTFIKAPYLWLRGISEYQATVTVAPNFAFDYCVNEILAEDLKGVRLDSLETILNGAEPVSAETIARFEERFGQVGLRQGIIRPVYGLAENCLAVTFSDGGRILVDEVDAEALEIENRAVPAAPGARSRKIVCVGRPVGHQQVQVVDASDQPVAPRIVGEIVVKGNSVMKGYFGRPDENVAALRAGWLHTGDLGYFAEDQLFVSGRIKDLIIRHGRNYYPQDIERAAGSVEGVFQDGVAVFSAEVAGNPQIVLIVEARSRILNLDQIRRGIREQLHHHFLFGPDDIRLVRRGAIPRTTSGKIRRSECRRLFVSGEIRFFELNGTACSINTATPKPAVGGFSGIART